MRIVQRWLEDGMRKWEVILARVLSLRLPAISTLRARIGLDRQGRGSAGTQKNDGEFISDVNAAILHDAPLGGRLVLWSMVSFFVVALVWASSASLEEVTRGDARVIPSSKVQIIQNLEGGIVSELLVQEGDIVDQQQPLLRLDDTRFSATYRETRLQYLALLAKSARLIAEAEGSSYRAPKEVLEQQAHLAGNEEALFRSRQAELESKLAILRLQQTQKQQELDELRARIGPLRRSYELVREELNVSEPLVEEGAISSVEILRLRRTLNDLKGELDATAMSVPRVESALAEASHKLTELTISYRTQAAADLNDTSSELARLSESMHALRDRVRRTLVRSPVRGIIKQLKVNTVGGVIQPGMDLMEIVPLEESLLVEARIRPADIAFLRPGQDAVVRFSAYDFSVYGALSGKVQHISADTIRTEGSSGRANGRAGPDYYLIRVETETNFLGSVANPLEIIPGMTASVDIKTGKKTVLDYLLKPVLKAREHALRER